MLVTVGEDEGMPLPTVNLKIFDLDKVQSEGSSTSGPLCVRTLPVFTDKFPEAKKETSTMRKEVQDLRTNARIFQLSKCSACTSSLDLPTVHFLCLHSFHQRCLGDNERECPVCTPGNRTLLDMKRTLEQNAKDHDRFFQLLRNSDDGFSVIAEYFGRGILNKHQ